MVVKHLCGNLMAAKILTGGYKGREIIMCTSLIATDSVFSSKRKQISQDIEACSKVVAPSSPIALACNDETINVVYRQAL